jgi:type I restriction enzyme M protein
LQQSAALAEETADVTRALHEHLQVTYRAVLDFAKCLTKEIPDAEKWVENLTLEGMSEIAALRTQLITIAEKAKPDHQILEEIARQCKAIRKPQDKLIKQLLDVISTANKEYQLAKNRDWKDLGIKEKLDILKALQQQLSGNPDEEEPGLLHATEYFYKQAHWLTSRFPEGVYTDVEGLCKVVAQKEIEAKDWSLSPGRYVGVDTSTDDDVDYEERLNEIHIELDGLNEEAIALAKTISENYKELAI